MCWLNRAGDGLPLPPQPQRLIMLLERMLAISLCDLGIR
jgi:hypothetical protein